MSVGVYQMFRSACTELTVCSDVKYGGEGAKWQLVGILAGSRKIRQLVLDSTPPYGVGVYEDAKARLKHQTLVQDYEELQKETDAMKSKLEAAKQRQLILDAEVRKKFAGEEIIKHSLTPVSELNHHKGRMRIRKETLAPNMIQILDKDHKERMDGANDATSKNSIAAFNLNQDSSPSMKDAFVPSQAPIFDLNEISTGDEDFQSNVEAMKFGEAKKSLIRGINDEWQTDLKLSTCRNAGEGNQRTPQAPLMLPLAFKYVGGLVVFKLVIAKHTNPHTKIVRIAYHATPYADRSNIPVVESEHATCCGSDLSFL
ncbi:UNVERIFIED_CONTAM: hypothetical protein Scaly_0592600 [Sesamum calycinum]|uniref:Uncharacterized protein n=1 Tax=Sesamum calycinum TaxID=2727403 RepID=A0AAW2RSC7_9LAMI